MDEFLSKGYIEYRYNLTLCKPNGTPIIILPECSPTVELTTYFDDTQPNELKFDITAFIEDTDTHQSIKNSNFDLIKGDFLILLETVQIGINDEIKNQEMFIIEQPQIAIEDSDLMHIQCYSRNVQLSRKGNVTFNGTRQLYEPRIYYSYDNLNWTWYQNPISYGSNTHIYLRTKDYSNDNYIYCDTVITNGTTTINNIAIIVNSSANTITIERVGLNGAGILNLMEDDYTIGWKVGHIDSSIWYDSVAQQNIFRTYSISGKTWTDIINNDIKTAYPDAHIEYDTINKLINIYDVNSNRYNVNNGLFISDMNYLKKLNIQPQFNTIYTKLHVYGNNISIQSVNPRGDDAITNYSYYQSNGYMSDDLSNAIDRYNVILANNKGTFNGYLSDLATLQATLTTQQNVLDGLNTDMNNLQNSKDVLIVGQNDLTSINQQIASKQTQINNQQALINTTNSQITAKNQQISNLQSVISEKNNFTEAQLAELSNFTYEKTWSSSNYDSTMVQQLYDDSVKALAEINIPSLTYSIDIADLFDILECQNYEWDRLIIGSIINIHYYPLDIDIELRLTKIDHKSGESLVIELSNKTIQSDALRYITNSTSQVMDSASIVQANLDTFDLSRQNGDWISGIKASGLQAAKYAVTSGTNQGVRLDEHGILLESITDTNRQMRIINDCLAISTDGFATTKTAVSSGGVIADTLIGHVILGNKLYISDEAGQMSFVGNLQTVKDGSGNTKVLIGEYAPNTWGINIKNSSGQTSITGDEIDGNNVNVKNINASNITSGTISADKIYGGTINGNNINCINLNASNINTGTLNGRPVTFGTSGYGTISLDGNGLNNSYGSYKSMVAVGTGVVSLDDNIITIQLPDSFKGKTFSVIVAVRGVLKSDGLQGFSLYSESNTWNFSNGTFGVEGGIVDLSNIPLEFSYVAVA